MKIYIAILLTVLVQLWLCILAFQERGSFGIGGEWLVILMLLIIHFFIKKNKRFLK